MMILIEKRENNRSLFMSIIDQILQNVCSNTRLFLFITYGLENNSVLVIKWWISMDHVLQGRPGSHRDKDTDKQPFPILRFIVS